MRFYSGFSLQHEEELFENYLLKSDYTVAGFSYGAQKAFEYAYQSKERIERLILLSPAFFQTKKQSFIRTQLRYFDSGKETYVEQFLKNVAFPCDVSLTNYLSVGTKEELEALLTYVWDKEKIQTLLDRGVTIEVFLGAEDKIIDIQEAISFFSSDCTTYTFKNTGHLLAEC
jgi:pimeloyl-ACP methyl ester carboxylesterase